MQKYPLPQTRLHQYAFHWISGSDGTVGHRPCCDLRTGLRCEPLYLASQLDVDSDAGVSKELGDCPYAREFSEVLQLALKRDGATFATGSVPTAKGRSLKVELVDFSLTGNGFIGHRMNMKFNGALYQDGSKVASFTDRTDFDGNGMITACAQVRTFMVGEASQVAKWVRKPVDGQELKRWGD